MYIVAISPIVKEFIYSGQSAHKVNKTKAQTIADMLNECGYMLKDGQTWHVHEIDQYDSAIVYAEEQSFILGKRGLQRKHPRGF